MQVVFGWLVLQHAAPSRLGLPWRTLILAVLAAFSRAGWAQPTQAAAAPRAETARRPSQGQAAGQFLREVLRADYPAAYGRLAPEVRRSVSLGRFAAAARPLWKSGAHRSREIELYKLGVRLGDNGASRLFYAFAFAADSSLKTPSLLLEVTFRDTAARAVLGFALRPGARKPPARPAK